MPLTSSKTTPPYSFLFLPCCCTEMLISCDLANKHCRYRLLLSLSFFLSFFLSLTSIYTHRYYSLRTPRCTHKYTHRCTHSHFLYHSAQLIPLSISLNVCPHLSLKHFLLLISRFCLDQCDQMAKLFFNIAPLATMKICPIA